MNKEKREIDIKDYDGLQKAILILDVGESANFNFFEKEVLVKTIILRRTK